MGDLSRCGGGVAAVAFHRRPGPGGVRWGRALRIFGRRAPRRCPAADPEQEVLRRVSELLWLCGARVTPYECSGRAAAPRRATAKSDPLECVVSRDKLRAQGVEALLTLKNEWLAYLEILVD